MPVVFFLQKSPGQSELCSGVSCVDKKDAAPRSAPKTKSEHSVADPVLRGGAREWMAFLQENAGTKQTLLQRGISSKIDFSERYLLSLNLLDSGRR